MYIIYACCKSLCVCVANQMASGSVEEELDEDIAVTQSQMNFTCPLTQVHEHIHKR